MLLQFPSLAISLLSAVSSKDGKINEEKRTDIQFIARSDPKIINHNGSTTNLRCHLKEHHKSFFKSLSADSKTSNSQKALPQTVSSTQPIPTSSAKWNKLTESVLYFILI